MALNSSCRVDLAATTISQLDILHLLDKQEWRNHLFEFLEHVNMKNSYIGVRA